MYIIFNTKSGEFHLSFSSMNDISINHGIYFSENAKENIHTNYYSYENNIIIFHHSKFIMTSKKLYFKDLRINIKHNILKKIIINIFKILCYSKKKSAPIKKYLKYTLFIILFLKIFSFSFFQYHLSVQKKSQVQFTIQDWVHFFENSKFASYVFKNKFDYFPFEVPEIKGIVDFRVLPLKTNSTISSSYTAEFSAPYSQITTILEDFSVKIKYPIFHCDNKKMFFYPINEKNELLILEKKYFHALIT